MNRWIAGLTAGLLMAGGSLYLYAQQAPKAESKLIIGEVIDIVTYAMKGVRGEEMEAAGRYRADHDFPIAIIEEGTDDVYIAIYKDPAPASEIAMANKILKEWMGKKVTAQGRVYRVKGVNLIEVRVAFEY